MNLGDGGGDLPSSSALSQWTVNASRRYQHTARQVDAARDPPLDRVRLHRLRVRPPRVPRARVDPEIHDGPTLPTRGSDEFRPFVRRLPEFKFWYSITKAFCVAFVLTFFSAFDVPVFWPILLFYWVILFFSTMKRQIMHMIKYKYVPFSFGKQRYTGKKASADDTDTTAA
ncbi:Rer1 family protein [Actinidia rufa]|uniref:Rer1 family protein n=1 Tax=Actinidia rufa TaxID=165716 RepID=A0A7J0HFI1_9ERIC|nr:Rer1 family protein [Actinidia rufa]